MRRGRSKGWTVAASGLLTVAHHPAYALGDQIIPGTAALVASPLLLGLFWGVAYVASRGDKTAPRPPALLVVTAALGLLFSVCWLTWLIVMNPSTWTIGGTEVGWGLLLGYVSPLGGLAGFLLLREQARPALVLLGSALVVGAIYWLGWQA